MANAFALASEVEAESLGILRPFIQRNALNGQFVTTSKGRLARELQKTYGDVFMNGSDGRIWAVEIKAERENRTGNFFLEAWSNLSRYTPGWLAKLECDLLFYHFIASDELYVIDFPKLQTWALLAPREVCTGFACDFPLKRQSKYSQLNDTHGFCVPITVIEREVGFKRFSPLAMQVECAA